MGIESHCKAAESTTMNSATNGFHLVPIIFHLISQNLNNFIDLVRNISVTIPICLGIKDILSKMIL